MQPLIRIIFSFYAVMGVLLIAAFGFWMLATPPVLEKGLPHPSIETSLTSSFEQKVAYYAAVDRGPLQLKEDCLSGFVKKLQKQLVFAGVNERPDKSSGELFIALQKENLLVKEKTPLYLVIDKERELALSETKTAASHSFLIFENDEKDSARVKLYSLDQDLKLIAEFTLERTRDTSTPFTGEKPLFSKNQTFRWIGKDLFLELHADPLAYKDKERFDLGPADHPASFFLSSTDCLAMEEGKWHVASTGDNTKGQWLLHIDRLEDRSAHGTLWSPTSNQRFPLYIPKSEDPFAAPDIEKTFLYLGTKNSRKWTFEVQGQRVTIMPGDWWLYKDLEWKLFNSEEEIDAYVLFEIQGDLLVFDEPVQEEGKKFLKAHLFNRQRNQLKTLRLAIQ